MPTWDDAARLRLCIAIIDTAGIGSPNWDEVAKKMGTDFSKEAVRQHFQKFIKKTTTGGDGAAATSGTTSSAPATPSSKTGTPRGKKGAATAAGQAKAQKSPAAGKKRNQDAVVAGAATAASEEDENNNNPSSNADEVSATTKEPKAKKPRAPRTPKGKIAAAPKSKAGTPSAKGKGKSAAIIKSEDESDEVADAIMGDTTHDEMKVEVVQDGIHEVGDGEAMVGIADADEI